MEKRGQKWKSRRRHGKAQHRHTGPAAASVEPDGSLQPASRSGASSGQRAPGHREPRRRKGCPEGMTAVRIFRARETSPNRLVGHTKRKRAKLQLGPHRCAANRNDLRRAPFELPLNSALAGLASTVPFRVSSPDFYRLWEYDTHESPKALPMWKKRAKSGKVLHELREHDSFD